MTDADHFFIAGLTEINGVDEEGMGDQTMILPAIVIGTPL